MFTNKIVRFIMNLSPLLSLIAAIIYGTWIVQGKIDDIDRRLIILESGSSDLSKTNDDQTKSILMIQDKISISIEKMNDKIDKIYFVLSSRGVKIE